MVYIWVYCQCVGTAHDIEPGAVSLVHWHGEMDLRELARYNETGELQPLLIDFSHDTPTLMIRWCARYRSVVTFTKLVLCLSYTVRLSETSLSLSHCKSLLDLGEKLALSHCKTLLDLEERKLGLSLFTRLS